MATVTAKVSLTSSNISSDVLNVALVKALPVVGDYRVFKKVIASGATNLETDNIVLANGSYGISYVLLHNTSTAVAEIITIGESTNTDGALEQTNMSVGAGEFAFFPWHSSIDLVADAASGNPVLEVMLFEAA